MTYVPTRPGRRLGRRRFKRSANYVPTRRRVPMFGLQGYTRTLAGDSDARYSTADFIPGAAHYRGDLSGYDDGLGFSLKPPKFVRKAARFVKKNVTLKRALIGGAIVGAAFIPGVGPAALAAARAAGGVALRAGRGLFHGAAAAERAVVGLFHRKPKYGPNPDPNAPPSGGGTPGTFPSPSGGGTAPAPPGSYPSPTQPGGGADDSGAGASSGGGGTYGPTPVPGGEGGGGDSGGDSGGEDVTADTSETATPAPAQASALPLLLGAGALLLLTRKR